MPTDQQPYDVGTHAPYDKPSHRKLNSEHEQQHEYEYGHVTGAAPPDEFGTPTLIELWRTAPYLHDGSAATARDVITMCNQHNRHGAISTLSPAEIDDLCAYLLSL